jgi:hypothetical protein
MWAELQMQLGVYIYTYTILIYYYLYSTICIQRTDCSGALYVRQYVRKAHIHKHWALSKCMVRCKPSSDSRPYAAVMEGESYSLCSDCMRSSHYTAHLRLLWSYTSIDGAGLPV